MFAGSDFVYSTYQDLSEFLKTYYPCGSIQFKKRISSDQKSKPLTVTDKAMGDFRNFNENFADKAVLLPKLFKEYAFNNKGDKPNEVLKIVDGPMAGLTGYLIKINRNKGLAFRVDNPYGGNPFTFGIPNIWDFHVTRLHNSKQDSQSIATEKPRAVDLLIGLLQRSGFSDENILKELYSLVKKLSDEPSLENATKLLLNETAACLNMSKRNLENNKNANKPLLKLLKQDLKSKEADHDHAKALTENVKDVSDDDKELIINLSRYVQEDPDYIKRNWSKLIIRPFLTPTSGIEIPKGKDYTSHPLERGQW